MEQLAGTLRPADVPDNRIRIMHPTALLGWLGAALSIALPWPQFWRSVVRGRIKGLSATACWQGVAMPIGWITYGLLSGEHLQIVTNVVTGVAGLGLVYGVGTAQPAVWASAGAGLASALIVCTILHLRQETPATAIAAGAARWRDAVTTRALAMTGI